MAHVLNHNGDKLEVESSMEQAGFAVRLAQDSDFYVIEANFLPGSSIDDQDMALLLKRFVDASMPGSQLAKILSNPLSKKLGVTYRQKQEDRQITGSFQLPKASWLNRKINQLGYDCPYDFVEHEGGHINHWQYIDYLAAGEYPLANSLCWQLIHDRVDHVIGALTTPIELLNYQRDFARKTIELKKSDLKKAEENSLTLTDFVDELTYKTTIQANRHTAALELLAEVIGELDNKRQASSKIIQDIVPSGNLLDLFAVSLAQARAHSSQA